MAPQHKNGLAGPSPFQTYTQLPREEPFSFRAEGSCSKERIKIWAGQFPAARNTGEAEQSLSALGQGLGCHGQLVLRRCRTRRVCKASRGQSQAWGSPDSFIRRTVEEKE